MAEDPRVFFADKARAYRESPAHGNRDELARMVQWLEPARGARALDVATGGGHTAFALARAGCRVVATDLTRPMLAGLDRRLAAVQAEAAALPFREGAFDLAASRIAPHHFPALDAFVREAARVLRPGGRFYAFDLTTPSDPAAAALVDHLERLRDPSHHHSWSAAEWTRALEGAGLSVLRLELGASEFDLEAWIARARMPPAREVELRRILAQTPPERIGGYGIAGPGLMRVLRVEVLARRERQPPA